MTSSRLSTQAIRSLAGMSLLALLLAILPVVVVASASEEAPVLRQVLILGLEQEGEFLVRDNMPVSAGDPLGVHQLARIETVLGELETATPLERMRVVPVTFGNAVGKQQQGKPIRSVADLVLDFRPAPKIEEIRFYPLVPIHRRKFEEASPIKAGDSYTRESLGVILDAIRKVCDEAGYLDITVTPHDAARSYEAISLGFIIEARLPMELHKLRFRSAGWGHSASIRKHLEEMEPEPFGKGSPVTAARLQEIESLAADLLKSRGYMDAVARLEETQVTKKGVVVKYRFERGVRYRMRDFMVQGTQFPDPQFWEDATAPFRDKHFTTARFREVEEAIARRAQFEGYMSPEVEMGLASSPEEKSLVVTASVDEGTTSVLGQVRIVREEPERGYGESFYHRYFAPMMKDSTIRRRVRVQSGEQLNGRLLEDAERRLWHLRRFDKVEVDTVATTDTLTRDIVLNLREKRTASLGGSIGWNDQIGAIVGGEFAEENVGGVGDRFMANGWVSLQNEGFGGSVSYLDRNWKLGERWLGREREPSMLYTAIYDEVGYSEYREKRIGVSARLGYLDKRLFSPWSHSWRVRLEEVSYEPRRSPDAYDEDFDSYIAATVARHLTYDTRNRGDADSTDGWLFDTGLEVGAADGLLVKWTNSAEWRKSLSRKWGWSTRASAGFMPYEATNIGLGERFQSGGLATVRGFEYRGIGPVDDLNDALHIGGATMTSLQNELRFIHTENIDVPLFADIGTLHQDPLGFGKPRASVGFGLRLKIPNTNQRAFIYFAQGISSEDTDDERSLHFGVRLAIP